MHLQTLVNQQLPALHELRVATESGNELFAARNFVANLQEK
jgi:hypothetical protein